MAKEYEVKFLNALRTLSDDKDYTLFNNTFVNPLTAQLSDKGADFYKKKEIVQNFYKQNISGIIGKKSDNSLQKLAQLYVQNPLGIFSYITDENFSDIFIVSDRISCTANNAENSNDIIIPPELIDTYAKVVKQMIDMTVYASDLDNTKFDRANAVLDFTVKKMRFNVVHESLNASVESPIIAIRKQTVKQAVSEFENKEYIKSLGLTRNQYEVIQDLAKNKSFIIFGETGSGKTTLLRYMCMMDLENKRNLISIEDTPELFLPVNITYLTNDKYKIIDLFKVTLRENPSHVVVGETRSEEIIDILQSGLTSKVSTTIHANSLEKAIMRIIFMAKGAKNDYSTDDISNLITATIDGFIYMDNRVCKGVWAKKENADMDGNAFLDYEKII